MKKIIVGCFALAVVLVACVNGKGEKGTHVDPDSLGVRDTIATLSPDGNDFMLLAGMDSCSFASFFKARVDGSGNVFCQFSGFEDENFQSCFSPDCPREEILLNTLEGQCCGIACMNEGNGVDPVLLLIMDDGHAERISLYDMSQGIRRTTARSEQKGIIGFDTQLSAEGEENNILAMLADSSQVDIEWK